ncbi:hypothetical protein Leryth_014295 [Lithospermum erythrorhizon]|nr:hypothetical protein Leryth_014295 [Lithospermum erythrorhizon]
MHDLILTTTLFQLSFVKRSLTTLVSSGYFRANLYDLKIDQIFRIQKATFIDHLYQNDVLMKKFVCLWRLEKRSKNLFNKLCTLAWVEELLVIMHDNNISKGNMLLTIGKNMGGKGETRH